MIVCYIASYVLHIPHNNVYIHIHLYKYIYIIYVCTYVLSERERVCVCLCYISPVPVSGVDKICQTTDQSPATNLNLVDY